MINHNNTREIIECIKAKTTIYPDDTPIKQHMMSHVSRERLHNLADLCTKYANRAASFVECGIANGGCVALMKHLAKEQAIWGFDSFEPMPDLTTEDTDSMSEKQRANHPSKYVGMVLGSKRNVEHTFSELHIPMDNVNIITGLFQDTLPEHKAEMGPIAILRIDCDWYAATKLCLKELYGQVIPGGVIIIDDYGCFSGCQKAVDEFRERHGIDSPLFESDYTERYWFKHEKVDV